MSKKIILSLFDFSGSWSQPYKNAGFEVIQHDLQLGFDVMQFDYSQIARSNVFGILAAPPCIHFTKASQHLWSFYDLTGETYKSLLLISRVLFLVEYFNPVFWALENPPGRLPSLLPALNKYRLLSFQPYQYGDAWSKHTLIFGQFNPFLVQTIVKPVKNRDNNFLLRDMPSASRLLFKNKGRSARRSITPPGFASAFFNANH
jgi:hypothetical protein